MVFKLKPVREDIAAAWDKKAQPFGTGFIQRVIEGAIDEPVIAILAGGDGAKTSALVLTARRLALLEPGGVRPKITDIDTSKISTVTLNGGLTKTNVLIQGSGFDAELKGALPKTAKAFVELLHPHE
jgi:hypothetical protein